MFMLQYALNVSYALLIILLQDTASEKTCGIKCVISGTDIEDMDKQISKYPVLLSAFVISSCFKICDSFLLKYRKSMHDVTVFFPVD